MKYFFFIIILVSCSNDQNFKKDVNSLNNDYSYYALYSEDYKEIIIDEDGKGINQAPVPAFKSQVIVACKDNSIKLLSGTNISWSYSLEESENITSPLSIDQNANIYYVNSKPELVSINFKGELNWKKELLGNYKYLLFSKPLVNDDKITVSNNEGYVEVFDTSGSKISEFKSSNKSLLRFPSDSLNNLFIPFTMDRYEGNDSLYKLSPDLKELASYAFNNSRIVYNPIISQNRLYVPIIKGSSLNKSYEIHVFDLDLNLIDKISVPRNPIKLSADKDGHLYVLSYELQEGSKLFKFNSKFELEWQQQIWVKPYSPIFIGKQFLAVAGKDYETKGFYYFSKEDGKLIKILSMSNAPNLYPEPGISKGGQIVFGSTNDLTLEQIENDFFDL